MTPASYDVYGTPSQISHHPGNGRPPVTVRVVDWADEEGARFGKSLFGSSACSGHLDMNEARVLRDKQGITLPTALEQHGIDFERVKECGKELANAAVIAGPDLGRVLQGEQPLVGGCDQLIGLGEICAPELGEVDL